MLPFASCWAKRILAVMTRERSRLSSRWWICAAAFVVQFLTAGLGNVAGVIFAMLLEEIKASRGRTGETKRLVNQYGIRSRKYSETVMVDRITYFDGWVHFKISIQVSNLQI